MDELRKPFLLIALALMAVVVVIEMGGRLALKGGGDVPNVADFPAGEVRDAFSRVNPGELNQLSGEKPPGFGVPYLALVDAIALFTIGLMALSLILPGRVQGRTQGCATLIFSIILVLLAIVLAFAAFGALILMISLFLAAPFGTITYFAIFGSFPRGATAAVLSLLMLLKLGCAGALVLAHQRFLQNIGLVLILLTSLVGNIIVAFLHGFVPGFLVSITDALGGLIAAILAIIWAIFLLIVSIIAVLKAVPPEPTSAPGLS